MVFDLAAWFVIGLVAYVIGSGVLALLGASGLRTGDRYIVATWIGVALGAFALLGASLFAPLAPALSLTIAAALAALGAAAVTKRRHGVSPLHGRETREAPISATALAVGIACIAIGAAALASDPVTLYDSLVYHVGIMRWLREHGTVPGLALLHNRLGHVSAWFALGAPFDAGPGANRAANIPLGFALVLVAVHGAIAVARIATGRALESDWFIALTTAALVWAAVVANAATPSPDVVTNVLIVLVAWSMLVVPRASMARRDGGWRRWITPRLIPLVLAVGATGMKLFAIPAAIAAGLFYILGRGEDTGARDAAYRVAICGALGIALLAPFLAANLAASGCPLFPSPVGCVDAPWSIGGTEAAEYAQYIRDVARWESRRSMAGAARVPWVGPWIAAHPLVTTLAVLVGPLAAVLLRGPRRGGVRSVVLLAVLGIAFAASYAPAPRFLFAFVITVPAMAIAGQMATYTRASHVRSTGLIRSSRATVGFIAATFVMGLGYAIASQKLNVRSAIVTGASAFNKTTADLLVPAAPSPPARLYVWRVNDIDLLTPVPRPIADTLSYYSAIDGDALYEQCSTAPLPCTPYLPSREIRLRVPQRGVAGGFKHDAPGLATNNRLQCLGELREGDASELFTAGTALLSIGAARCDAATR